jgi:hypothetical protein
MNMYLYVQRKIHFKIIGYVDKLNKLKKCYTGCMSTKNKGVNKDDLQLLLQTVVLCWSKTLKVVHVKVMRKKSLMM